MTSLSGRVRGIGIAVGLIASILGSSQLLAQATGTVRGTVVDSSGLTPIQSASVIIVGTRLGATTDNEGRFVIRGVPSGQQTVRLTRIGYAAQTKVVTVPSGGEVTADFTAARSAVQLDQLVVTVTGAQRTAELGHVVSLVQTDSLVKNAPIFNISDMLTSRVPSAMVDASNGLTGQVMKIRIRGLNSFTVGNDPLVIVDGARIEATTGTAGRLGDLNMAEIEAMEIVKGPAAATLYGTDAANGVIVIRTKRGKIGATRWEIYGEQGMIREDTTQFPNTIYGWGHSTAAGAAKMQCPLFLVAQGSCIQDSITRYNPLKDPQATAIGHGRRGQEGIQASGGVAGLRYFVSGGWERELGWMTMPVNEIKRLKAERGVTSLPEDQLRPNYLSKVNLRGNMSAELGKKGDVSLANGLTYQDFRNTSTEAIRAGYWSPGFKDTVYSGYSFNSRIGDYLSVRQAQHLLRYVSSINGNFRPVDWLATHATLGLDFSHNYNDGLQRNGEGPPGTNRTGQRSQSENAVTLYSFDAGGTATRSLPYLNDLQSRTSAGFQLNRRERLFTSVSGTGLPPGSETITGAATITGSEVHELSVVVGTYLEQQVGWRDRLYGTAAVRFDGASTFGKNLHTTAYPKFSLSWLASQESFFPTIPGLQSFRLRGAVGSSGVQPPSTAGLTTVGLVTASINNAAVSAIQRGAIGNPGVRPERATEKELGFDIEALSGRMRVEATYYNKLSTDALVLVPFAASAGGGSAYGNIGSVSNKGLEGMVNLTVIDNAKAAFDITVGGSVTKNSLVSVGPDAPPGFFQNYSFIGARHRVGYPLYGGWQRPLLSFADANGDGVIAQSEIVVGDTEVYIGPTAPTRQLTVTPGLSLWRDAVRISGLFDYRGGYMRNDYTWWVGCVLIFNCPGAVDKRAPLKEQADVQAYLKNNTNIGYWTNGAYTRLRELTITARLPQTVLRHSRASAGSFTLAGRNLLYWSGWTGGDPEVGGGSDLEYSFPTPPLARYFIARLNLSY